MRAPSIAPGAQRSLSSAPGAQVAPASVLAARRMSSARPPEPVKPTGVPRGILLALLGVAACLGLFLVQRARARGAGTHEAPPVLADAEPSRSAPLAASLPKNPAREVSAPPASATPALPSASALASAAPAASVAAPPEAAASAGKAPAASGATRTVTLEVSPPDAKVFTRGLQRKGPPYTFDIRRGARLLVEVVRPGYVARRVVLDGSRPEIAVGLIRKKVAGPPRTKEPAGVTDASEERGSVVQSGL
jgi:hypothetical protein